MAAGRKRSTRVTAGDIFEIAAPDGLRGYGQIIVADTALYIVVFRELYAEPPNLDDVLNSELLLVGWTLDALIHHGEWKIVGNRSPIAARVPFPSYKVRVRGVPHVHDFNGMNYRFATAEDWELLHHRTTVAPIRYESAFLACHGLGEWRNDYEEMTVEHARRRVLTVTGDSQGVRKH